MGMVKKSNKDDIGGDDSNIKQSSNNTLFITNIPLSSSISQLQEVFSEVGPIRRCFIVTKKGSNEHRGFGYVKFAATRDANRAVELKNGAWIGGRKLRVEKATQRAPLEHRRPKGIQEVQSDDIVEKREEDIISVPSKAIEAEEVTKFTEPVGEFVEPVKEPTLVKDVKDEGSGSGKQRVARTVIFGGLLDAKMAESVHLIARDCGNVLTINYPLPKGELEHHGLSKEGCKEDASSVLFTSVKSARDCVATLHQRKINGGLVWARQLGGEGSKTQKWKLIIRNLPFEVGVTGLYTTIYRRNYTVTKWRRWWQHKWGKKLGFMWPEGERVIVAMERVIRNHWISFSLGRSQSYIFKDTWQHHKRHKNLYQDERHRLVYLSY